MKIFTCLCPWLTGPLGTLESAALAGRLGHGWLISGPRDSGKRNLAYVVADRLLERQIGTPAPAEAQPEEIATQYAALAERPDLHPDLFRLCRAEDRRTISVEQVRELIAVLALTPHIAQSKVVVIEEAESMTTAAANALLKSLEEPTPNTYLLLLADRPGRLPATVRSRCQHLPIRPPTAEMTAAWLKPPPGIVGFLPGSLLRRSPLAAARSVIQKENYLNYSEIYDNIEKLYDGKTDPHAMADNWHRTDADLGLACLVDSLMSRIRGRLVPERWTPVTESRAGFADNPNHGVSTEALFDGLEVAEALREQLGRGVNVELALKALLLGLEPSQTGRVST